MKEKKNKNKKVKGKTREKRKYMKKTIMKRPTIQEKEKPLRPTKEKTDKLKKIL